MTKPAQVEALSRALAARVLKEPDWSERLDPICLAIRDAGNRSVPGAALSLKTAQAVAARAEAILRDINALDPLSIGQRYFDLLPRQDSHPLTAAVIAALNDGPAVIRMLRACGTEVAILKDDAGTSFIEINDLHRAPDLGEGMKAAIRNALAVTAEISQQPQGALHQLH